MANNYKNIVITPNINTAANVVPVIRFSGGDGTSNTDMNVRFYTTSNGTLSFEGSAGQLFSITNDLTNSIFAVNDVSGIPSIDVNANGDMLFAPYGGNVKIGTANTLYISGGNVGINTITPTSNLHVVGSANITGNLIVAGNNITTIINAAFSKANTANDIAVAAFVKANTGGSGDATAAFNQANAAFIKANTANDIAVSAFTKANAALPNTSGVTFGGNLTISSTLTANTLNSLAGFIDLGPGSRPAYAAGRVYYDNVDNVLTVYNNDSGFILPLGQKEYVKVLNDTASTLERGKPVYATGFHATSHHHLTVDLADASDPDKYDVVGLVAADIPAGEHGAVITRGWLGGINTSSLTAATRFHLGFATPGSLITVAPEYPNYPYDIGYCIVSNNTNGFVYVDRQSHTFERLRVSSSARVGGDLTVEGNFNVLGAENTITVNSLEVGTQFIYLGVGDSIPNANVYFTGSGLNDIDFTGHYEGNTNTTFYVVISDVNPDKFSWSYQNNFSTLVQQNVVIQYQTSQALSNGISIFFNSNTGHTVGDKWNATAFAAETDFGFVGNHISGANGYSHAGLFRDASDGTFKFFRTYDPEIEGNINTADSSYALGNVQVERITAAQVYEGATRLSDSISVVSDTASSAYDKANSANIIASQAFNKANAANVLAFSFSNVYTTIAGANTTVGGGANAFAAATIAGANTAVGGGANNYLRAIIAGANTAVGAGANAFAAATIAGANVITTAAFNKANATTYTSNVVISVNDTSNAALRITQFGTAEAFRVENTTLDSTPFVILASSNVGIGTANPTANLHIVGGGPAHLKMTSSGATDIQRIIFGNPINTGPEQYIGGATIVHTSNTLITYSYGATDIRADSMTFKSPDGSLHYMTITNSAVGVGFLKSSPVYALDVDGTISGDGILINGTDLEVAVSSAFAKANSVNVRSSTPLGIYVGTTPPAANAVGDLWIDTN